MNDKVINAARIYLDFSKEKSIINIQQTSKTLNNKIFLQRERKIRNPYAKHMRIGLSGIIQTTINAYKKKFNREVTHIGIYLSNPLATSILNEFLKPKYYIKKRINLIIVEKEKK